MRESFRLTRRALPHVLRHYWQWFVALGVCGIVLDEYSFQLQKFMDQLDSPPPALVIALLSLSILWTVLSGALTIFVTSIATQDFLAPAQQKPSVWKVSYDYLKPLTIETLRAFASSLIWCFAFIIPGVIRYIEYTFVPYIVMFDQSYHRGEIDALEHSRSLVRGRVLALALVTASYILLLLGFYACTQTLASSITEHPLGVLIGQIFLQLMNCAFMIFLFALYKSLENNKSLENDPPSRGVPKPKDGK